MYSMLNQRLKSPTVMLRFRAEPPARPAKKSRRCIAEATQDLRCLRQNRRAVLVLSARKSPLLVANYCTKEADHTAGSLFGRNKAYAPDCTTARDPRKQETGPVAVDTHSILWVPFCLRTKYRAQKAQDLFQL